MDAAGVTNSGVPEMLYVYGPPPTLAWEEAWAATMEGLTALADDVQAVEVRLELRPLLGEQAMGFTYTLPLCRGLR